MALIVRGNDAVFRRGSPVLAYWLAHSEGFRIRRRLRSAVVEGVFVQPPGRVTALSVRSRVGRRRIVPADAVEAVVPAERLLLVAGPARAPRPALPSLRPLAHTAATQLEALARAAEPRLETAGQVAVRRLEAAGRAAVRWLEAAGRAAGPWLEALAILGARIDRALLAALRRGFERARDGDSARRWLATLRGETTRRAGELRSAISRCSWFEAGGGSGAASDAESGPAAPSSSDSSSS